MSAIVGERDVLIMGTVPRFSVPIDRALMLTASATTFEVSLAGAPTPGAITFTALMLGATGAISFSAEPATPLTVANDVATLTFANMAASIVTVTASAVIDGVTYVARQTINKTQALDLTPPPAPTGLVATGKPATIELAWNAVPGNYHNLGYTEVWRATVNNFAQAALVGRADGRVYIDAVGSGATRYYWIRYISLANIPGPYNASSGTVGASDIEVEHLLQVLTHQIAESQLFADLGAKIDLIVPTRDAVVDLELVYGDTVAAAASASAAAQSAAAAVAASVAADLSKAAADAASGGAGQYAAQSAQSATNANTSAGNASTSAGQSSQSATNALGSAGAAASSASTAAGASGAAGQSATAASTSKDQAAGSATAAGVQAVASNESRLAAQAARDASGQSAAAALLSSNSASASATDAGDAAYAASQSAITANSKAGAAGVSQASAALSETNAGGSASQAAASAQLAAQSRDAAGGSAVAAAGSASTASTKSNEAGQSATSASASLVSANAAAGAAGGAATTAGAAASAAAGSASTADARATAAGQSAISASNSENTASTKSADAGVYASQAASSKTLADGSAAAAASSLQQVQAIYRADPTNLCQDPTFARGVSDWSATGLLRLEGNASWPFPTGVRVQNRDNIQVAVQVPVSPGDVHYMSAWVYNLSHADGPAFNLGAQFTGANGYQSWATAAFCAPSAADGHWLRISGTLTVPAGAQAAQLWMQLAQGGEVQDKYWVVTGIEWRPAQITQQVTALVNSEIETRTSQNEASAGRIDNIQASITGPGGLAAQYAAVKITSDATVVALGQAQAKYAVRVDAGGVAGGFELIGGGGAVDFGVRATTFYIAAPAGAGIPSSVPFIVRTTETVVGGVTIPIGVYIADAFIQNASITNAKIGGDIWSSNYAAGAAGWKLSRAGDMEVNTLRARGYVAGGAFTNYAWPAAGAGGGFYLGPEVLRLGNFNNGQFFEVNSSGEVRATEFSIVGGRATFAGMLYAVTGTFGSVSIASGGSIASGQTAYNVGTGFWLGVDAGVPKFSLGTGGSAGIRWDGSNLYIVNPVIASFDLAITAGLDGSYFTMSRTSINVYAGSYTATATNGSGNYSYLWRLECTAPRQVSTTVYANAQVSPGVSGGGITGEHDFYAICTCTDTNSGQSKTQSFVFTVNFT